MNALLEYQLALGEAFQDAAEDCLRASRFERAAQWIGRGAHVLTEQSHRLLSLRMESALRAIAPSVRVPADSGRWERPGTPGRPDRPVCLHVLSSALPFGGHTAMATHWMTDDDSDTIHCAALLSQHVPVPERLERTVRTREGRIYVADRSGSLMDRAGWLRGLAHAVADHVVLHVDVDDVMPALAFGVPGGPPVAIVNHAAHIFWLGGGCADLIVNCRGSELEREWTVRHRGLDRCATVPIPLQDVAREARGVDSLDRAGARARLGLPPEATIILTVGASYKYSPLGSLDFVSVAERILAELPGALLIAVGAKPDARWSQAATRTGGRLRAVGPRPHEEVGLFHHAADLYVEGFPVGSTTALLEAGLHGLPAVLSPSECPPPFATDGVAVDSVLQRPASLDDYQHMILELSRSPERRAREAAPLAASVRAHHTGSGWNDYVRRAIDSLPREHTLPPLREAVPTPDSLSDYWARFIDATAWPSGPAVLERACLDGLEHDMRVPLTHAMRRACMAARPLRTGRTMPLALLRVLSNGMSPLLPTRATGSLLRTVLPHFRPGRRVSRWALATLPAWFW